MQAAWLRDHPPTEVADFWRVSPRGLATIVRDYGEDRTAVNARLGLQPGTWFSPNALAQELAELVFHARAFARFFGAARTVGFRCEWWGLAGRKLFDPRRQWVQSGAAENDRRLVVLQVPVARLAEGWPDVVASLMAPLLRAIEPDLASAPTGSAPRRRAGGRRHNALDGAHAVAMRSVGGKRRRMRSISAIAGRAANIAMA